LHWSKNKLSMEKVVRKYNLNEQPNDLEFWLLKSEIERLRALETLRQYYIEFFLNGHRQGFQRVYRVIK
jgi:hypothetical protein